MSLPRGTRIGMFEILAKIGEGGMGEVYRARDTRLGRDVALKVLPDIFTSDPDRLARFEREARVLASLNHPNIAQVYGFELTASTRPGWDSAAPSGQAIVMELVEGPTLADMLRASGSMPFERAHAIARQIAAAMDAAHDGGIIHRDLKPANIKVREDGTVKVLDFGLAKALIPDSDTAHNSASDSPTITAHSAEHAVILGTAAYMAPEQAKGRAVDRRADVWAFGAVLFEMLSGRRAFDGDDVSDVIAAVLKVEPDWSLLPSDVPPPARRLLRRCLEKDPKKRLRDIAEGMMQFEEGLAAGSTSSGVTLSKADAMSDAPSATWWERALPIAGTAAATAIIATAAIGLWGPSNAARAGAPIRMQHVPGASAPVMPTNGLRDVTVSMDGQRFAYVGLAGQASALYMRSLDQLDAAVVPGTARAAGPFFSPDGEWLGFVTADAQSQIMKVPVRGGSPVLVAKAPKDVLGAFWTAEGIVAGQGDGGLQLISTSGGAPVALTEMDRSKGDAGHVWPSPVSGTEVILFTISRGTRSANQQVAALDRATGTVARLSVEGLMPHYVASGSIVYATIDGGLRAVPFDPKRLEVTGPPVPLLEGIGTKPSSAANVHISPSGHLIYSAAGTVAARRTVVWTDRDGRETPIAAPPRNYFYARVSPDTSKLALSIRDEKQDVWIWDLKRDALLRLTQEKGACNYGIWTRDGRIIYDSDSEAAGRKEIFSRRADGAGQPERVTDTSANHLIPFPNAVSPDGRHLIFRATINGPKNDLFVATMTGPKQIRTLASSEFDERNAAFSPDGSLVVFESDKSGEQFEIYLRPFDGTDGPVTQVSIGGGVKPLWSPDGTEIYYLGANKLMAVPVTRAGGLRLGKPVALFETTPYFFGDFGRNYDLTPDGKRFVMVKNPGESGRALPIMIVLNWAEELRKR